MNMMPPMMPHTDQIHVSRQEPDELTSEERERAETPPPQKDHSSAASVCETDEVAPREALSALAGHRAGLGGNRPSPPPRPSPLRFLLAGAQRADGHGAGSELKEEWVLREEVAVGRSAGLEGRWGAGVEGGQSHVIGKPVYLDTEPCLMACEDVPQMTSLAFVLQVCTLT